MGDIELRPREMFDVARWSDAEGGIFDRIVSSDICTSIESFEQKIKDVNEWSKFPVFLYIRRTDGFIKKIELSEEVSNDRADFLYDMLFRMEQEGHLDWSKKSVGFMWDQESINEDTTRQP